MDNEISRHNEIPIFKSDFKFDLEFEFKSGAKFDLNIIRSHDY